MGWWSRLFDGSAGRPADPEPVALPAAPTSADILTALDRVLAETSNGEVPGIVTARIRRVDETVREMVPRLDRLGGMSQQGHTVVATATSYLPEAVEGYLRLPRDFADRRAVYKGKTSLMILCDQLDLLGATLDKISDAVSRADANALIAHGQFLAEKFTESTLSAPAEPGTLGTLSPAERFMSGLGQAVTALASIGTGAGLDAAAVRAEAGRLAAAVCESAPGAGAEWIAELGGPGANLESFYTAAASARRWRNAPTELLTRLVAERSSHAAAYAKGLTEVISAASALGEPGMSVIGGASATAAAQLAAVGPFAASKPGSQPTAPDQTRIVRPDAFDLTNLRGMPEGVPSVDDILAKLGRGPEPAGSEPAGSEQGNSAPQAQPEPAQPAESEAAPLPEESLDDLLAELDGLIGLDRVKREIKRQAQLLRIDKLRAEAGMATPTLTRHLVFTGNPGTGKTTVARLVSRIYRALGILSAGKLVEVDRSELVAGYLGQTASKTADVIASARGGVLFIDEAYALASDQYGAEAVTTLVKDMEDHRGDLVVIVAGYSGPMQGFLDTNPGLASRFSTTIDFADYTDEELRRIFESTATKADFDPTPATLAAFDELASQQARTEAFGNGRWVRNTLDGAIARHAWRLRDVLEPSIEQLRTIEPEDLAEPADPERVADAVERGLRSGAAAVEPEPAADAPDARDAPVSDTPVSDASAPDAPAPDTLEDSSKESSA